MAYATPDKVRAYRDHLVGVALPELQKLPGFMGLELCEKPRGDQVELLVISRWQSMAAIAAYTGGNPDQAVVEPGAKAALAEYDDFVTNYEVTLEAMGA